MTVSAMEAPQRSSFVTVLAWIFIAISGYMTLTAIFENVMLVTWLPTMGTDAAFAAHSSASVLSSPPATTARGTVSKSWSRHGR